ncbi:MAG: TlyA family RNA methyltransferase [Eubacterium sp.]|nr:TlyA family RNA methyltransferase [Eubacterium sp.]
MGKERLDVLLVNRGLCESRSQAKAVIMAGEVFVDGQREDKAGASFAEEVNIEVRGKKMPYVSRGGFKLEHALEVFPLTVEGLTCMDVGSSTGGFTDCMLQNGAVKVYAIDVGTNQLAWKLRQDERVVVMEKTNIRYVMPEDIGEAVDFVSIDVAFISLEKVLKPVRALMKDDARMVALIKPQFEAGREQVGKKGVVRDPKVHKEVIRRVLGYATEAGFTICGIDHSPIRGPEGNIEYLLWLEAGEQPADVAELQAGEQPADMAELQAETAGQSVAEEAGQGMSEQPEMAPVPDKIEQVWEPRIDELVRTAHETL